MSKKRFISTKICTLSTADCKEYVFADCREMMRKYKFSEDEIALFIAEINDILTVYRKRFGEEKKVEYIVRRKLLRVECSLIIKGEKVGPYDEETESSTRRMTEKALKPLLVNKTEQVSYIYSIGRNFIMLSSPEIQTKAIWKSPVLWAIVLGIVVGIICYHLPQKANSLIIDDILSPVFNVTIGVVTGIMAPVILISMITAVSALQSINDLTHLGFKIIGRFLISICSVMVIGIAMTLLFYHNFGVTTMDFGPRNLVEMILSVIPTDIVSPLLKGNAPQLVVLGLFFGAALLLLGNRVDGLKDTLGQINAWIMTAMGMAMVICPVLPFISIASMIARGQWTTILKGWEFILLSYLIAAVCGLLKLLIVCIKFKVNIGVLWKKLWPMISISFSSGNNSTMLKTEYEISKNELGIKPEFSSFWIPMSQALLNPRQTINMIIPPILIMKYIGSPMSLYFLLVYALLLLELSIASPGTTAGWTIMFASLGLPSEYVGTFMMYKILTANFNAAYGALQAGLEQIESANRFEAIDLDKLREKSQHADG